MATMPTVAEIVAEELRDAERRIQARLAALLGGQSAKTAERFRGRVRARLTPDDVANVRKRVLDAVKGGASTAGEIQAATSLDRHRATYVVNLLRDEGRIRRRGKGRRARYFAA